MKDLETKKAVIYARVSSKEQEETGYSLASQEKLLQDYATRKECNVVKIFSVAESASGAKQRKVFSEMIDYMQKTGITILLCEKVDRLTRNLSEAVTANEWLDTNPKRQIHFVKQNLVLHTNAKSDEKFRWDIEIVLAKKYISNLSEEVKKGQKEKVAQGWLPTKPPLGYKTVGEKGHKIHVLDTDKSTLIRKMFELYSTSEYSISHLVEKMYTLGLRSRNGRKVVKSRIAKLLSDPFYYGDLRWNGVISKGKHEPIISRSLFEATQEVLRGKNTPSYTKHNHLFKGLIRCKECGGFITWEIQKGITYGHCNKYKQCTKRPWYKEEQIEEQLIKEFQKVQIKNKKFTEWITKALKQSHKGLIEFREASKKELNDQLSRIEQRLDLLYEDRLDRRISTEQYDKKRLDYEAQVREINEKIQEHQRAGGAHSRQAVEILDISQRAEEIYLKAKDDVSKKRKLLRFMFEKIELNGPKLTVEYTKPFMVLARAVQLTNSSNTDKLIKSPIQIFELKEYGSRKRQKSANALPCPVLLRGQESLSLHEQYGFPVFWFNTSQNTR